MPAATRKFCMSITGGGRAPPHPPFFSPHMALYQDPGTYAPLRPLVRRWLRLLRLLATGVVRGSLGQGRKGSRAKG